MDLPPLPLEVLQEVEKVEGFAQDGLARCWTPHAINLPKAIRLLCTCVVEVFDIQAKHYTSMPDCSERWLELIESNTRQVALGLCNPRGLASVTRQEYEEIDFALRKALDGRLKYWRIALKKSTTQLASESEPLKPGPVANEPFPYRASWLKERLRERAWDHNDPFRFGGPDRKTVMKILAGEAVKEETLEKLTTALNSKNPGAKIKLLDIPTN